MTTTFQSPKWNTIARSNWVNLGLFFFNHDDHLFKAKDVETGPGAHKLEALKKRAGKERVAAYFESDKDLYGHVIAALTHLHKELDMREVGDATASLVSKLHRKSSIPELPTPYIAHPYTLLQSRELVGRQAELNTLTDWVTKPGSPAFDARIFCALGAPEPDMPAPIIGA
jgi:hypothetical protein